MRLLTRRVFRQEKRVRRGSARSIRSPGRRDGNAFFRSENTLFPAWESTLDVANIFPNFPIAQPFCIHTGGKPSSVRQPYISYRPRIYRISVGPLLVHPILRELCNFSTNGIIIFFVFFVFRRFTLIKEHLVEFNQLAMANAEGSDNMLNRVMPKDNIGLAALLRTTEAAWDNGE